MELMDTAYVLVPHGDHRWNYRFTETVNACAIPVVIADGISLPFEQLIDWHDASVQLKEEVVKQSADLAQPSLILDQLPSDPATIREMRRKVCNISKKYFRTNEKSWKALLQSAVLYAAAAAA